MPKGTNTQTGSQASTHNQPALRKNPLMKTRTTVLSCVIGSAVIATLALTAGANPGLLSGNRTADAIGTTTVKASPHPKQETTGFDYWNESAETFRYASKTGKVAAPPTSDFLPGTKQDLEVPYNVFYNYDSTVTWNIFGFDGGPQIGTMKTSVNNAGEGSLSFTGMDGKSLTSMTWTGIGGGGFAIQDTKGSPAATGVNTYAAGSAAEQTSIANLCQRIDITSRCSFSPLSQNVNAYGAKPSELGVLYNGSTTSTSQLTAGTSESYSVTDSWGATVSAQQTLNALQLGIQATYSHSIATTDTWDTQGEEDVAPLSTSFIWGFAPVVNYTGTFALKIGNTTFSAPGATYSVPDKTRPILYSNQTFPGNTASNPQPPTQATALAQALKAKGSK